MPPGTQTEIDSEVRNDFPEQMFGQLYSERELILVW